MNTETHAQLPPERDPHERDPYERPPHELHPHELQTHEPHPHAPHPRAPHPHPLHPDALRTHGLHPHALPRRIAHLDALELREAWRLLRGVRARLDRIAHEERWPVPFSPVRYLVLAQLQAATAFGLSPRRLARLLAVPPSTLAHHLDALERVGLVSRRPASIADMRKVAVRLTEHGRFALRRFDGL